MNSKLTKLALTAALGLAMTFTACEEKKKQDGTTATEPVAATETQKASQEAAAEKVIEVVKGSFTDTRDKKTYKTVKIGEQVWMAENLNYDDPDIDSDVCYNNDPANCKKYGRLYFPGEFCPKGWHLPTKEEWEILVTTVGGNTIAGKYLKAQSGWNDDKGKSGNGIDNYGFSALPGGYEDGGCDCDDGYRGGFEGGGDNGYWWSAWSVININNSENSDYYIVGMSYTYESVYYDNSRWFDKRSIRCIQDDANYYATKAKAEAEAKAKAEAEIAAKAAKEAEIAAKATKGNGGTFTDTRDEKTYKTTKIGKQIWMAENLNYATGGSKCGGTNIQTAEEGTFTYYTLEDKNTSNCDKYGRLYDWSEAMGIDRAFNEKSYVSKNAKHQGVCPAGWHLPNNEEWKALVDFAGGGEIAGKILKAKEGWNDNGGKSGNGANYFGFSALPSGWGNGIRFYDVGNFGDWWSASEYSSSNYAYKFRLYYNWESTGYTFDPKSYLYSIRCIQN